MTVRGSAAWWDERYAGDELVWTDVANAFLVEEASALAPGAALDLAAGEGRNAVWLARRGWRATAVDFSPVACDKARRLAERAGVAVEVVVADVLAWAPPSTYDLVVLAYLHLPPAQRSQVLGVAASATAPGGSLLVIGHDLRNLRDGTGGPQDPSLLWTPAVVAVDGWAVARAGTEARAVGDATAWDTVVRLVRP